LKQLRNNKETYEWMMDNIAPLIVGMKYYKEQSRLVLPTVWFTKSSEAFALLCIENYYHHVVDSASNKTLIRKPKWTSHGIRAKRNQGWKQDGITQYDTYYKMVTENRAHEDLLVVDTDYLEKKKAAMTKQEERKRKRDNTRENRESGWAVASYDAWSDEDKEPIEDNGKEDENSDDNAREDEITNTTLYR
jgi:hypothetical protein